MRGRKARIVIFIENDTRRPQTNRGIVVKVSVSVIGITFLLPIFFYYFSITDMFKKIPIRLKYD